MQRIDFERIENAAKSQAESVLSQLFPGGKIHGREFECASLDGGKGQSFKCNLDTTKWAEFNGGATGVGLISLAAEKYGKAQGQAAIELAQVIGIDPFGGTAAPPRPKAQTISKAPQKAVGASKKEKLPPAPPRPENLVKQYHYYDREEQYRLTVNRYEAPGHSKTFRPGTMSNWETGEIQFGLNGVEPCLFNENWISGVDTIFLCEGEKDCDTLTSNNLTSTTNVGGAGNWKPQYNHHVKGKNVVILQDNDEAGEKRTATLIEQLGPVARTLKALTFEGLSNKGDVTDFFEQGGTLGQLWELVNAAPVVEVQKPFLSCADLMAMDFSDQKFVIGNGILPEAGNMILAGESGVGKSMFSQELAVHLALGWDFLSWEIPTARRVLIIQLENSLRTEQVRLKRMLTGLEVSAPPQNLMYAPTELQIDLNDAMSRAKLVQLIQLTGAEVVIMDPLSCLHCKDENSNSDMRPTLNHLTAINREIGTTFIVVHHFGKPQKGQDNAHRARGASAIRDWADTMMALTHEKDNARILRRVEFPKIRHGPELRPFFIEKDQETFLSRETIVADQYSENVAEIVRKNGGRIEGMNKLAKTRGSRNRGFRINRKKGDSRWS